MLQLLQSLVNSLVSYQANFNKNLENIVQIIRQQIGLVEEQTTHFQMKVEEYNQQLPAIDQLNQEIANNKEKNWTVIFQIQNQIQDFQQRCTNLDQILGLIEQHKVDNNINILRGNQKFEYKLIEESNRKEERNCFAFAFSKGNNVLAVGQDGPIIVYELQNGKILQEIQRLNYHTSYVSCLYFLKQSKGIVSGSYDNKIIIWSCQNKNQWYAEHVLKDENQSVICFIMNKNEDLLVSGSNDNVVRFWKKCKTEWVCQQYVITNNYVYALSFNEKESKIISCELQKSISIMEQYNQTWALKQKIDVNEIGYRICFTIGDQFAFQATKQNCLQVYDFDNINEIYKKSKEIQVSPCEESFIKQLGILCVKHGNFINIFNVTSDGDYKLIQTIKYKDKQYSLYGSLSDDGYYLATWDESSREIQMRKLVYQ